MESRQFRSSVIAKAMRFNGVYLNSSRESFLSKDCSKVDQERLRVVDESKGFLKVWNFKSGFKVIPTKELCRVYLKKPDLLASKGVIDALARPPQSQRKGLGLRIFGEVEKNRRFGRRYDQQNLKSKLRPKVGKKEGSVRSFSPLGFGTSAHLRDRKNGLYMSFENKSKKLCDGGTGFGQKKDGVGRIVGSKLMVTTSRDSVLRLGRLCNDRVAAADVKLRQISSSAFICKDENQGSLNCSTPSPGCQANSEEAHQPSPVSVLEPMFCDDMLDDGEEFPQLDFHGLENHLETLKSEYDSYSDGSGMEVSSDEESVLDSEPKESEDSKRIGVFNTQESRDSSYIDGILAEVVLGNKSWVPDKRDSLDLVITPKIFEKLEKKYYTETSWKRSERRILFDRVNSALVEILESFSATPTWRKPVSRRLGTVLSTCGLKQELWKVLDRQEKRAKKASLARVPVIDLDDWLEFEADDDLVVCELESMLVDELLAEVVSFM